MDLDRRRLLAGALSAAPAVAAAQSDPTEVIPLWPKGPPGGGGQGLVESLFDRARPGQPPDRAVTAITHPRLTVFRPGRPNGHACLIAPGGGYVRVVVDKEGFEFARFLAARGITAYVLYYRLPADGWTGGRDAPLQDVQRALRLVRAQTQGSVAALGFSAGGHVTAQLLNRFAEASYPPQDAADMLSARPDAGGLIYPVISMDPAIVHAGSREKLVGANAGEALTRAYSMETRVRGQTPPTFLVHAADDASVPMDNSLRMYGSLRAAGVPTEAHWFQKGGHGFGMRGAAGKPAARTPELFHAWWMRQVRQEP
ncbi:alpha/beta hydrolase [Phenylobacterium sp. J367]|uniref:alpha/beta hydrolase n=1 Tax=Phenylobacterium sp. J367 TaxID=2898435 RepID=UPI002151A43B|nr:alpha/beta hydrolase [Phenylobacterium sp. J367]MCR5879762.1 alpha/beta hydrolase [Phenylobacterium sp. J367]